MRDVANAAYTLFCALMFVVFMFATVTGIAVTLGLFGDTDSPLIGLFCTLVFWYAAAKYRRIFRERIENVQKNINKSGNDDEQSDDQF